MSLLIVSPTSDPHQASGDPDVAHALAEASRQGFDEAQRFEWGRGCAWWFATPGNPRGSGAAVRVEQRFAACVGTLAWRGLTGEALLRRLLAEFAEPAAMPLCEFTGSFVMLFSAGSGVWLFNDAVGLHKTYETAGGRLLSTSFMVCRATLASPGVDRLRAQEYVLLGANHARATPIEGIAITDPTAARELGSGRTVTLVPPTRWTAACPWQRPQEAVEALAHSIAGVFADMARAFGPNIGMALSGGFDSRLLLAALDRAGVAPSLYVYGTTDDEDVKIASGIARGLGMSIECIDKRAFNRERPPLTPALLQSNLAFFDGLPPDGAFDLGVDRATRLKQVEGGRLNLNGGGGEILRNFFYLRDRDYSAAEVVSAFYSNWPREVFPDDGQRLAFLRAMEAGVADCVGHAPSQRLARREVELVYSLFRLRYWMGRNNSLAGRYGAFLTPLPHPALVPLAAAVPLAWKHYGQLEAAIIRALSPRVASGPSAYGFSFATEPHLKHRLRVAATLYRPVALRPRSAQVRRALGLARTVAMPDGWRDAAAPLPAQDWVDASGLWDADQLNRLLTLQAVASDAACGIRRAGAVFEPPPARVNGSAIA